MIIVELVLLHQEAESLYVPGDMAGICHDYFGIGSSDESFAVLLEVTIVVEW
jgi:hypothetical protein